MLVSKVSPISNTSHEMNLPITQEELDAYYKGDVPIQKALPQLNADQREFLMTGITPQQWDETFE